MEGDSIPQQALEKIEQIDAADLSGSISGNRQPQSSAPGRCCERLGQLEAEAG